MRVGIVVLELLIDAGAACAALGLLGAGSAAFTAARRRFIGGGDGGLAAPSPHGQPHGGDSGRSGDSPSSREPAPGS
ncbi:hypothetical protein [Variovorax sp.]|uniref:hypothetical protein n=1 Tax=Variovorax sp. TaxID=1871043 RepID=UPI000C38C187|nr:hypothetical protein [Variovorax sp.]MBS78208.1 hypothetical protein [Variovorax sp.]